MSWSCRRTVLPVLVAMLAGGPIGPAPAATFSSGSTGSLGALAPVSNTTVVLPSDGILHYTTVTIPSGVTVTFQRNAANTPVTLLAQGDVSIAGTISVKGDDAVPYSGDNPSPPSLGGPGGFAGGQGGTKSTSNNNGGAGGAGGGGGLLIASTTQITISPGGMIRAHGGAGNYSYSGSCDRYTGGAGSGGAIRLVAPQITHQGLVEALGGAASCTPTHVGIPGRIRVECTTCTTPGTFTPAASVSATLGPVSAAGTPGLTSLPTLTITMVGGMTVPGSPGGAYATADLTLSAATTNPVTVTVSATNIPVGTIFTVRVLPEGEPMTPFLSLPSTGTFASSTASASVNFKYGKTSVLSACVGYTQVAALLPLIDGEPVEQLVVAAGMGTPSSLSVMTPSGKEVAVTDLPHETQIQIAMAFAQLRERPSEPRPSRVIWRAE